MMGPPTEVGLLFLVVVLGLGTFSQARIFARLLLAPHMQIERAASSHPRA
jgi:hypothetical protein